MKDAEGIGLGQVLDYLFIFCDGKIGISAMGGIDHHLEEFLFDLLIDPIHHLGRLGRIGEVLEFHATEEFEMPRFDRALVECTFLVATGMNIDHLLNGSIKSFALQFLSGEPFFKGSRGHMLNLVLLGHFQTGIEHVNDGVLVLRVERVGTANHHDQMNFELESLETLKHIL